MRKPLFILLVMFFLANAALARNAGSKKGDRAVPDAKKSLDFDGDVVEGLNRRPLDSLTATSEENSGLGMGHSYQRQKNFGYESQELAKDLAETY